MSYEEIRYEIDARIAEVTLDRPDRLNAWTWRMGAEVRHALLMANADPEVRAIIVTGTGRGYCAGADMDMLQGIQAGRAGGPPPVGDGPAPELDPALPAAFRGEYSYPLGLDKPVIAAVNGVAAGLGLSYILYYDLRIASDRARFGTMFARRGLVAEHGSSWLLPRLIGMHNACDLLFSGRLIDAQEALRMGLVNRVVPHEELMAWVRDTAREMAELSSPRSLRIMKRQLYQDLFEDLGTSMSTADREMVASFGSEDFREGVASFVQRRSPRFTGR